MLCRSCTRRSVKVVTVGFAVAMESVDPRAGIPNKRRREVNCQGAVHQAINELALLARIQPPNHMVRVRSECFGRLRGCHELMTIFNARIAVPARWSTSIEMPSRSFSGRATNFAAVTAGAVSTGGRGIACQSRGNGNGNHRKTVCCTSISALTGRWSPSVSVPCDVAGNWRFRPQAVNSS